MRQRLEGREPIDYQVERSNEQWVDHQARALVTGALIAWQKPTSVLDPACGDGSIVLASMRHHNPDKVYLSDVSIPSISRLVDKGLPAHIIARADDIYDALARAPRVGMVVLTEILEHVEDPERILRLARETSGMLVASSPEMRHGQVDTNPEHLWMFDGFGYNEMLADSGWTATHKTHMSFPDLIYDFGIWVCR
jgi:2-polyprenyl-3-methyl-5-hydroxy-6-metoxy-1,4-benzoquinol methylase